MSHIPGVKPSFKEEWKKEDKSVKNAYTIGIFIQIMLTAIGFFLYFFGEMPPEKYGEQIKLQMLFMFGLMGYFLNQFKIRDARQIRRGHLVKMGLRYDWDEEDLDELEERVRKLEEK